MQAINEILQQFSGLIYTIVGALIGWGCTELSRRMTNSYQKKQTLNSSLSLLLELYFQLKRISSIYLQLQEIYEWYIQLLTKNEYTKDVKNVVACLLKKMITPIISNLVSDELKTLCADYEKAMKDLARYYPVTAYKLHGRADMKYVLINVDDYLNEIENQFSLPISEYEDYFTSIIFIPHQDVLQNNLNVLKDEILILSKKNDRHQRKEILKVMDDMDMPNEAYKQRVEQLKTQLSEALDAALRDAVKM